MGERIAHSSANQLPPQFWGPYLFKFCVRAVIILIHSTKKAVRICLIRCDTPIVVMVRIFILYPKTPPHNYCIRGSGMFINVKITPTSFRFLVCRINLNPPISIKCLYCFRMLKIPFVIVRKNKRIGLIAARRKNTNRNQCGCKY